MTHLDEDDISGEHHQVSLCQAYSQISSTFLRPRKQRRIACMGAYAGLAVLELHRAAPLADGPGVLEHKLEVFVGEGLRGAGPLHSNTSAIRYRPSHKLQKKKSETRIG